MTGTGRSGEEDYVLKQAFLALVPAFDPRPGRTNVPQIQDFHVPAPGTEDTGNASNQIPVPSSKGIKLALSIRVRVHNYKGVGSAVVRTGFPILKDSRPKSHA